MMDTQVLNGHAGTSSTVTEKDDDREQALNDLISTLSHDIGEIRIRALQCLQRKLDHELIPTQDMCKRVDLLNRLTSWLNSNKWTEHELLLIVHFLSTLCQYEDFCNIFRDTPLDKLLSNARQIVRADTRVLIDRLMDTVRGHSQGLSFDIHCQGLPEICNDNSSVPFAQSSSRELSSRKDEPSLSAKMSKSSSGRSNISVPQVDKIVNSEPELQFYFKRNPVVRDKIFPGISTIRLDVSDRRVLASTVESLLSRNEGLIYLTTCFARDVLLNDFPTETFVQECSVSQSLVTVVQERWDDQKLNYAGFQALYKLANLLRSRFAMLNSSEFYSCGQSQQNLNLQRQKSIALTTSSRNRAQQFLPQFDSSTDYFVNNLCQLIKTVSHALVLPKSRNIHLWVIMDNLCYTLNVCVRTFNFEAATLAVQIEEILMDMSECIPKSGSSSEEDLANPPVQILALVMTSLLNSFEDSLSLRKQVRQGIWNLVLNPHLFHVCPSAFQQYLDACCVFEPKVAEIGVTMKDVRDSLEEIEKFLQSDEESVEKMSLDRVQKMIQFLQYFESSESERFLQKCFSICTESLYEETIPEIKDRISIIVSLMAHTSNDIRVKIYSHVLSVVKKHFGPKSISTKKYEDVYEISIVLWKEVLEEILQFGLRDNMADIEHCAEEIISYLLKSQIVIGDELWNHVLASFNPLFQLLQVHADPQTVLGKIILNLFDPTRDDIELTRSELLAGNLRFIFSSNSIVREDGSERVLKLITTNGNLRYSGYSNYTLASVFNVSRSLEVTDHCSRNDINTPYQAGFLLKQMKLAESDDLDASVRRNALQQMAVLLEDVQLHGHFIKNDGVESCLSIVSKIIDENDFKFSLDLWSPTVRILKLLAMHNEEARTVLADTENEDTLLNLTCGLLSIRSDDIFRIDTVHLMSLILFHPYLKITGGTFSLPQLFTSRCRIPINANVYMTTSPNAQQNLAESELPLEHIFQYWWKVNKTRDDGKSDPKLYIRNEFFAIQNATEHSTAVLAIEKIWERVLPLVLNKRVDGLNVDEEILHGLMKDCQEAFSRFMSVEPTSPEDEDLLAKILDLFGFLLKFLVESSSLREWAGPFVKGSPLKRVLLQQCLRADGTLMTTVVRSLFDFYAVLESGDWLSEDAMYEVMCTFTQILHKLSTQGFTSPAVLHSVFHGLTNLTAKPTIIEKLKNNQEFSSGLLDLLCDGLFAIEGRTSTYRNIGSILYGATSVLHLIMTLKKEENPELIKKCFQILPVLWASDEPRIRAVGFQVCSVINSTKKGTTLILWEMDSPIILWEAAYKNLLDHQEPSIVRQKAGCVLLNLIIFWDEIVTPQNQNLGLPRWRILKDMLKLLPHIFWNQKLSSIEMRAFSNSKKSNLDLPDQLPLVTPKLLSIITKIIVGTIRTNEFKSSSSQADENEKMTFPEICSTLFRLIGNHALSSKMDTTWWTESCNSLNNSVKAIISLVHFDRKLTAVLISDKISLAALVKLFQIERPPGEDKKCITESSSLWMNVFTLLTIICKDADFEDFEQLILIQRNLIFPTIIKFIELQALVKQREISLDFLKTFLQGSCREITSEELSGRNKLWQSTVTTHGKNLCQKLMNLISNSMNVEERSSAFMCCHCLYRISPSLKVHDEAFLDFVLKSITDFGSQKSVQLNIANLTKRNLKEQEEIVCIVHLLSATVFESETARNIALNKDLPSALHLILKFAWTNQNLLHGIIECLINFTNDFPKGAHSLTVTTGLGIPARKTPTANSIFVELLGLLHRDLENVDSSPNPGKTVQLLFSLIKNCVFSNECRNCLVKINILSFIKRLHVADPRKWKHQQMKMSFLNFLLDLSVHPDMQLFIAKLPEAVEILILLAELDPFSPTSTSSISLQILRNISFNPGNRLRLLNDSRFMHHIVQRLKNSDNNQELETVGVILWAAVSNCEKGKVLAKQSACGTSIFGAIQRLKKRCANQAPGKGNNEMSVILLLEKVSKVLDSSAPES